MSNICQNACKCYIKQIRLRVYRVPLHQVVDSLLLSLQKIGNRNIRVLWRVISRLRRVAHKILEVRVVKYHLIARLFEFNANLWDVRHVFSFEDLWNLLGRHWASFLGTHFRFSQRALFHWVFKFVEIAYFGEFIVWFILFSLNVRFLLIYWSILLLYWLFWWFIAVLWWSIFATAFKLGIRDALCGFKVVWWIVWSWWLLELGCMYS